MSQALAGVLVFLAASAAWACPVCGAETDTKATYISMTLVMSGLPLLMIGSVVLGVAIRFRRAAREEVQAVVPDPQRP